MLSRYYSELSTWTWKNSFNYIAVLQLSTEYCACSKSWVGSSSQLQERAQNALPGLQNDSWQKFGLCKKNEKGNKSTVKTKMAQFSSQPNPWRLQSLNHRTQVHLPTARIGVLILPTPDPHQTPSLPAHQCKVRSTAIGACYCVVVLCFWSMLSHLSWNSLSWMGRHCVVCFPCETFH